MALNDAGRMVEIVWNELPKFYPHVSTDAFQIMPNHTHGIIVIVPPAVDMPTVGAGPRACPDVGPRACPDDGRSRGDGQPRGVAPTSVAMTSVAMTSAGLSLPDIVHRFKTMTTKQYVDGVKQHGWPPFPGQLWQRNYYEHIIRNENEMARIREYITNNPAQWPTDRENIMVKTNHTLQGQETIFC